MRMLSLGIFLLALLSPSAFAVGSPQNENPKLDEKDLADVSITLEWLGCTGGCPDFYVEIHGDGRVIYEGRDYVKVTGRREHKIPKEKVAELVREFYRANYFSLKDEYVEYSGPGMSVAVKSFGVGTSISIGGKKKSVYERFGTPQTLKDLEAKIYVISGVHQYVSLT
jgi:hypothetical protein